MHIMKGVNGLLLGVLLAISIIGLSACGEMKVEKNTEEVISEQAELELNNSDEVLKILEMPLENGRVLKLFVIGKKSDGDIGLYGVREICIYEEEKLLQSILIQEAINIDGVDGIDEGYSGCMSAEESAALKDVNFDGYLDLEVCAWTPNNSIPYYYWCWNNDKQQFEYSFCLQLSEIDQENKQLIAWYKIENGLYYTDYYHVNDKNQLELINREIEDIRPK